MRELKGVGEVQIRWFCIVKSSLAKRKRKSADSGQKKKWFRNCLFVSMIISPQESQVLSPPSKKQWLLAHTRAWQAWRPLSRDKVKPQMRLVKVTLPSQDGRMEFRGSQELAGSELCTKALELGCQTLSNKSTLLSPNYIKSFLTCIPFCWKFQMLNFLDPYLSSHCDVVMPSRSRYCRGHSGMDDN